MSEQNLDLVYENLRAYFQTQKCCIAGLAPLKEGVEIAITLRTSFQNPTHPHIDAALFRKNGQNILEKRAAFKPDIRFEMTENAVRAVSSYTGEDIGQFGIQVVQQILLGEVKIKILGGLFSLMANGYLGIIKSGGAEFLKLIGQHGFSSLSKFPELIKKMRE